MPDLSKIKMVAEVTGEFSVSRVNALLSEGWQILSLKVTEVQTRVPGGCPELSYVEKKPQVVYVLGLPREQSCCGSCNKDMHHLKDRFQP